MLGVYANLLQLTPEHNSPHVPLTVLQYNLYLYERGTDRVESLVSQNNTVSLPSHELTDLLVIHGFSHKPLDHCPSYNQSLSSNYLMFLFSQFYLQCWCHGKVNTQNLHHLYHPHFKVQLSLRCHTMLVSHSNNKRKGLRAERTCMWQVTILFPHFKTSFF